MLVVTMMVTRTMMMMTLILGHDIADEIWVNGVEDDDDDNIDLPDNNSEDDEDDGSIEMV